MALSAAVQYLGTLDFGVQTFVNQDLTLRYQRGDMDEFHIRQSTALRLLVCIVCCAAALSAGVLLLPLQSWLRLDGSDGARPLPALEVSATVYLLALQVLSGLVFNYFTGSFMILGKAHIGGYWSNIQRFAIITVSIVQVLATASFVKLALAQFGVCVLCICAVIVHLRFLAPKIFPTLRYWHAKSVPEILRKSGYFGLIYSSNFLVYQVPVLIMQRDLGPQAVVTFTVMRTLFSMTRQTLNGITQSIGPEITNLFAISDWKTLAKLYDYSERLVFALIPAVNIGTLLLSPLILSIWLHKPTLFVPELYVISASISIVSSTKEHKFQFQFSTNTHVELARIMFATYVGLATLSLFGVPRFGVQGFLWPWLIVEAIQLACIFRLNQVMFSGIFIIPMQPLIRLAAFSLLGLLLSMALLRWLSMLIPLEQAAAVASTGVALFAVSWRLFSLGKPFKEFFFRPRSVTTVSTA